MIGVLMLDTRFTRFVGDIGNPESYTEPVLFERIPVSPALIESSARDAAPRQLAPRVIPAPVSRVTSPDSPTPRTLLLGNGDYAVMVKDAAKVFLGGPPLVKMAIGEDADDEELGGAEMHSRVSGLSDYLATDELAIPDDRPAHTPAVTIQVLGGGVNDEVCPKLERLLQRRRAEAVIDCKQAPCCARDRRDGANVRDAGERVRGRLHVEQPRVGTDGAAPVLGRVRRYIRGDHAKLGKVTIEQRDR